jgi:hypothetical protein
MRSRRSLHCAAAATFKCAQVHEEAPLEGRGGGSGGALIPPARQLSLHRQLNLVRQMSFQDALHPHAYAPLAPAPHEDPPHMSESVHAIAEVRHVLLLNTSRYMCEVR